MDVVVANILSKWYSHFYELFGVQIRAPHPFDMLQYVSDASNFLYKNSPPVVRTYYNTLKNIPVQSDIIPIALAVLILYALFSAFLMTIRGVARLFYGFVRLSIFISIMASIICIVLPYISQFERMNMFPFEKFAFSSSGFTFERHPI